ncbi:hypothetical protein GGS20DRAFT_586512 [Poronia punctata]|nr:hypothetical protein GGS20DRAFT_586512 [Poronia punctata]
MPLARHVNPEDLIKKLRHVNLDGGDQQQLRSADLSESDKQLRKSMTTSHLTPYGTKYASKTETPKYRLPQEGAPADAVYQIVRNKLDLDGRPNLNLASFVGTYMEPNAMQLMTENRKAL